MSGEILNYDYLLKYIIVGEPAVGKSNLLLKYSQGQFNSEYQTTIGVEFGTKTLEIRKKIYRIQIWDTAGQESFRSITRAYFQNSACAIVVYDITDRNSFINANTWIEECNNQCSKTTFICLVGNKLDLANRRQVTIEEGKELAEKNKMLFFETSAKDGTNVDKIFYEPADNIAKNIYKNYYDLENEECGIKEGINRENKNNNIMILDNNNNKKKKKKFC